MPETQIWISAIVMLGIAILYSIVGHGGASGYIAILGFFLINTQQIKQEALILNILVSGIAFFQFFREGHFSIRLFWPFAVSSIPLSYLGSSIAISADYYKIILGSILFVVAILFFVKKESYLESNTEQNTFWSIAIGAVLGFVSGMTGIGGGVFLSPIILMLGWANQKQTAATSALFIFCNSIAGILAVKSWQVSNSDLKIFIPTVVIGSILGSWLGARMIKPLWLKYLLAIVLLVAAFKLICKPLLALLG